MSTCDFCEEEFEDDRALHIHWGEEHEDELNSHQQEKVKKAKREKKDDEEAKSSKRRSLLFKGLTAVSLLIFVGLVLPQVLNMFQSSPFQLDRQPMMGSENATVTVVEFGDYQCPHCKDFDNQIKPQLKEEYIDTGKVKFYYINLPVINQKSNLAAVASEYVYKNDPKNYWKFHSALFDIRGQLNRATIIDTVTETTNITEDNLSKGLQNQKYLDELKADRKIAKGNGVTSTPTVYVNGEKVGNTYQSIKSAIENNLKDGQ